jgi:hypothetical protein
MAKATTTTARYELTIMGNDNSTCVTLTATNDDAAREEAYRLLNTPDGKQATGVQQPVYASINRDGVGFETYG